MSKQSENDQRHSGTSHDASVMAIMSEVLAARGTPTSMGDVREMIEAARKRSCHAFDTVPTGTISSVEAWAAYARWIANFASEALFSIRRGVILDSERCVAIYFDNDQVKTRPSAQAAMVMALTARGIPLVAAGACSDDYTTVHIFRGWRSVDIIESVISHTIQAFGIGNGEIGTHLS